MDHNIDFAKHNSEPKDRVGDGVQTSFISDFMDSPKKARSSHRLHYEAQVEVIRKQIGNLDQIREILGLSQRKICQLLMVDPSAWTRWTKKGESAPPHIYRALQWYMILQEKIPGLTPQYFVGKDPEVLHQTALLKIKEESTKRQEFEEAFAIQNLNLEKRIEDLLEKNQDLIASNESLSVEIRDLKKLRTRDRFWLLVAAILLSGFTFWLSR